MSTNDHEPVAWLVSEGCRSDRTTLLRTNCGVTVSLTCIGLLDRLENVDLRLWDLLIFARTCIFFSQASFHSILSTSTAFDPNFAKDHTSSF